MRGREGCVRGREGCERLGRGVIERPRRGKGQGEHLVYAVLSNMLYPKDMFPHGSTD